MFSLKKKVLNFFIFLSVIIIIIINGIVALFFFNEFGTPQILFVRGYEYA